MSDLNLNDPNLDGRRFDPIERKFKTGMAQEAHEKVVKAGLKMMGAEAHEANDIERFLREAKRRIQLARVNAHTLNAEAQGSGIFSKEKLAPMLVEHLAKDLYNQFGSCTKDELLLLLVTFFTELTIKEMGLV